MRISQVLAFAAAAATFSVSAFADPSIPATHAANTVLVQASPHAAYHLSPDEARHMVGTFQLDDGRTLTVTSQRSKVFAEFDGKREELVPTGGNRFVSRDSGAELTFDRVPFADEVVLNQAKH
jgi:hypothetical protein